MSTARRWTRYAAVTLLAGVTLLPVTGNANDADPWEAFNRSVFLFNDTVDAWLLKPLAIGYKEITPQFIEDGVSNIFNNVGDVGNLANNLLQGKFHNAGVDTARLMINTTVGVLGFFDVASYLDLPRNDEDFGQTLGVWGMQSGPYIVLPLLGPSTPRDAIGRTVERFATAYPYIDHVPTRNSTFALNIMEERTALLNAEKIIVGDKYSFIRNAYLQNREFRVQDGKVQDDF